jgi:hypothetical protein
MSETGFREVLRPGAAAAAGLAGICGVIGVVIAIQGDKYIGGAGLISVLAVITLAAFGAGFLAFWRPFVAGAAMVAAVIAYAVALSGYLGDWWTGLNNAISAPGSAVGHYWSTAGALLAFQIAGVLLIAGAIMAFLAHDWTGRRTGAGRPLPTA